MICPDCGCKLVVQGGCNYCPSCGYENCIVGGHTSETYPCPYCKEGELIEVSYLYGDDADGNRGEMRYAYKCDHCGEEEE